MPTVRENVSVRKKPWMWRIVGIYALLLILSSWIRTMNRPAPFSPDLKTLEVKAVAG